MISERSEADRVAEKGRVFNQSVKTPVYAPCNPGRREPDKMNLREATVCNVLTSR